MTEEEAVAATQELFGSDSFTECCDEEEPKRYYVGALPKASGPYIGYMGFSWEEALDFARRDNS